LLAREAVAVRWVAAAVQGVIERPQELLVVVLLLKLLSLYRWEIIQ
jgi:hypothetical protein